MKPSRMSANRAAHYRALNPPITIEADMSAFNAMLDGLDEDVQQALRPAIQAGAEVLYRAVLRNVEAIGTVTGTLKASIYQAYATHASKPSAPVYEVSWRTRRASGLPVAPHGHLLEHGWIQRYAVHMGKDGKWHTVVRPQMRGKPKPKRGAAQSVKDAYYVLRPGGPVQHPAKKFVASAQSAFPAAVDAAIATLWQHLGYSGA